MNETLFKIHKVDIDAVGLGDFGKRGNTLYSVVWETDLAQNPFGYTLLRNFGCFFNQSETCVSCHEYTIERMHVTASRRATKVLTHVRQKRC